MNKLKLILFLVSCITLFMGCYQAKVIKATKYQVKSGVPNGAPVYRHKIVVKIKKPSVFTSIVIDSLKPRTSFSVINQETNMQSDNSKTYPKGTYILQFDTKKNDTITSSKANINIKRIDSSGKKVYEIKSVATSVDATAAQSYR